MANISILHISLSINDVPGAKLIYDDLSLHTVVHLKRWLAAEDFWLLATNPNYLRVKFIALIQIPIQTSLFKFTTLGDSVHRRRRCGSW
jgi:hypothetical protein